MKIIKKNEIDFKHSITCHPSNSDFILHNHSDILEIHIFIRCDAEFRVEGSIYKLNPYDTVVAANNEMHKIIHLSDTEYERIVISINTDFFVKNNCNEYAPLFYGRPLGLNNLIPYEETKKTYFTDCLKRLEEYYHDKDKNATVIKGVFMELLHILNSCYKKSQHEGSHSNKYIRDIILYINENLTNGITLDEISEHFFINKSYLCRIFKQHTGYTVNKYITHKRIMLVRELCAQNMSITQASFEAGFGNYSNFYKMYVKEMGTAPKYELKK